MDRVNAKLLGDSSSSNSSRGVWTRVSGIPKKCQCGALIVEQISGTVKNPGRRFYRCEYAASMKLKNDRHLFKWVDEAFGDERGLLEYQVGVVEDEVTEVKGDVIVVKEVPRVAKGLDFGEFEKEFEKVKIEMAGIIQADFVDLKRSMKMMMAYGFCTCVLLFLVAIIVVKN